MADEQRGPSAEPPATIVRVRVEREALAGALRRVAAGDRAAFEEVYRRTSAKLFGTCLRILPGRSEAEDALQDAFLAVWRKAGSFDGARGSPMTWLITLARNSAIDRRRTAGKAAAVAIGLADDIADERVGALALLEADEEERRLAACLDALDAGDARFLRTAFFHGASYPALAEAAGLPLGTVKSRIRRALLTLRACLG